ncbi:hypothetical protein HIM_06180 [Hirsutella minnesotensis 3608]|uniref:Uncharacterized protein n=1 Tax=Hirsutella minnesotensis 3608 TaxID=1043627 RepID=A0A0F7ZNU7_9HYPO|nr:hypothetical protein HIM_06180 [Hirsutella minnesotensis 3608]
MAITIDNILLVLQKTLIHPIKSLLFAGAAILFHNGILHAGIARKGDGIPSLRGTLVYISLGCVALSWTLHLNRALNRKALNPSPAVPCDWPRELVVVTGGSGGIGEALVKRLESLSATVVILDASPPTFKLDKRTHYFKTDVSSLENVLEAHTKIVARIGLPTILVANAGVLRAEPILDLPEDDIRATFNVNILGVVFCMKAFLPAMIKADHGQVLVTSSVTAYSAAASVACYSASKAAVSSLVEGLQTELKHKHGNPRVKLSAVFPGPVRTKMFEKLDLPVNGFFMPYLEPAQVAERMCQILSKGESDMVMMPAASNVGPSLHAMSHWVRVAAQDMGAGASNRLSESRGGIQSCW